MTTCTVVIMSQLPNVSPCLYGLYIELLLTLYFYVNVDSLKKSFSQYSQLLCTNFLLLKFHLSLLPAICFFPWISIYCVHYYGLYFKVLTNRITSVGLQKLDYHYLLAGIISAVDYISCGLSLSLCVPRTYRIYFTYIYLEDKASPLIDLKCA